MFRNVCAQLVSPSGKPLHVPSEKGRAIGMQVRELLRFHPWDEHYRHLGGGDHISILHAHRENAWFCTADLSNFFPSIRRNRVAAALKRAGVREHQHFAKWCTTRLLGGGYALPYGFPASTLLATLVMQDSPLGAFLRAAARIVRVEVWVDDISMSSPDDPALLGEVYEGLLQAAEASGFGINARKSSGPAKTVRLFGCDIEQGRVAVSEERRAAFYAVERTQVAAERFERYCSAVEQKSTSQSSFIADQRW